MINDVMLRFLQFISDATVSNSYIAISLFDTVNKQHKKHYFFKKDDCIKQLTQLSSEINFDDYDIYIRATSVKNKITSGRGKKSDTAAASFCWADIDYYKSKHANRSIALKIINSLPIKASCIVSSGHGFQLWFALDKSTSNIDAVVKVNKIIATRLSRIAADNVSDSTRLLRVAGSYNHKNNDKIAVTLVDLNDKKYTLQHLTDAFDAKSTVYNSIELPDTFLNDLHDEKLVQRITSEKSAKNAAAALKDNDTVDVSRNDAYIADKLLAAGYAEEIVASVLTNEKWFSSSRYAEKHDMSYVQRTIKSALKHLADNSSNNSTEFFTASKTGKGAFIATRLAKYIMSQIDVITVADSIYIYKNGVYKLDSAHTLQKKIAELLADNWRPSYQAAVMQYIIDQSSTDSSIFLRHDDNLVNVANGMLNVVTGELLAHSAKYKSFTQLAVKYDANAVSERIKKFVTSLVVPDALKTFWQFMGFLLLPDYRFKKALLIIGDANTGKSSLLELISRVLGRHNVASVSLQDLTTDRFAKAELFAKVANIYADLNLSAVNLTGQFKSLTGGDTILVQRKFKQPFNFVNTAKLIFSANDFASVSQPDAAFFSRFIVIPFKHRFVAGTTAIINIVDTFDDNDLSAFLNYSLAALKSLLKDQHFTIGESSKDSQRVFLQVSDSIMAFIYAATVQDDNSVVSKSDFYMAYRNWCVRTRRRAVSSTRFFRRIKQSDDDLHLTSSYRIVHTGEAQKWCFVGRRLLDTVSIDSNGMIKINETF